MKRLAITFLLALLMILGGLKYVSAEMTAVNLSVSDRGTAFSLMQQTASSYFSISVGDFQPYQSVSAPTQIYPLLYLSEETKSPPDVIWRKHKGHGWGRTAKEMGLPANYHGKYMSGKQRNRYQAVSVVDDGAFDEMMTIRFIHDYYGTDPDFLFYWHSHGLSYEDLFIGVNLATRIHCAPREFFLLRTNGRSWQFIANRYRVPYTILNRPVRSVNRIIKRQPVIKDHYDRNRGEDDHNDGWRGNKRRH
jgi:hypothetical protein